MEAKLRLQFCAILSQLHRHKEALEQAQEGIKLAHLIIRDSISVCRYYSRRMDLQAHFGDPFNQSMDESIGNSASVPTARKTKSRDGKRGVKRTQSPNKSKLDEHSKSSYPFEVEESTDDPFYDGTLDQYVTKQTFYNNTEGSISIIEKNSKKLLPIYQEVLRRISTVEVKKEVQVVNEDEEKNDTQFDMESSDIDSKIGIAANIAEPMPTKKKQKLAA